MTRKSTPPTAHLETMTASGGLTPLAPLIHSLLEHLRARLDPERAIVHVCACRRRYTQQEWEELPLRGILRGPGAEELELRDCVCGSTRALELPHWAAEEREVIFRGGPFEHLADARPVEL